jgi:hypothetical protein
MQQQHQQHAPRVPRRQECQGENDHDEDACQQLHDDEDMAQDRENPLGLFHEDD